MSKKEKSAEPGKVIQMKFDDNNLARNLFGPQEAHLKSIRNRLGVDIHVRGGEVSIQGERDRTQLVEKILTQLYSVLKKGHPVLGSDVEQAIRILSHDKQASLDDIFLDSIFIPARRKVIAPRSTGQKLYIEAMRSHDMIFGVGPAGTGKTYLAMAMAVTSLMKGEVKRIILTRPAIEAGEKLGFLPGDLVEKVNPYLRPLYDALNDMLEFEKTQKMLERGEIEVAPLAFMRGRTLNDAYVILDEAQNCTVEQMRMFLTRIGFQSKTVITGDVTQIDLPREKKSGLIHAVGILQEIPGICIHYLNEKDVVRHPLVSEIIKAYERNEESDKQRERS
ncbi:MAG: PhoH family protein [Deltaproteobacteria bacterium]|nr:PhoH family protein [Deltaproteobacteria bacterium]